MIYLIRAKRRNENESEYFCEGSKLMAAKKRAVLRRAGFQIIETLERDTPENKDEMLDLLNYVAGN